MAKVEGSKLTAEIIPGPGKASKFDGSDGASFLGDDGEKFSFNFSAVIEQFNFYEMVEKPQPTTTSASTNPAAVEPSFEVKRPRTYWRIRVSICVHGDIDLEKLQMPLGYEAVAGKTIEDFAKLHNKRRRKRPKAGTDPDTRPTTWQVDSSTPHPYYNKRIYRQYRAPKDLPDTLDQLVKLNKAQSDGIGAGWSPSTFYKLKRVFLAKGDDEYYRKMLRCDNAVVRAMAMDCMRQKHGNDAFSLLRSRLPSRAILVSQYGCITSTETEGHFARLLMMEPIEEKCTDPNSGVYSFLRPRMTLEQMAALVLEILSRDDMAAMHDNVVDRMIGYDEPPRDRDTGTSQPASRPGTGIFDDTLPTKLIAAVPLDLPALRKLAGGLSDTAIIKAVGRLKLGADLPEVEAFLIKCVGDTSLDANSRLAGASALTRWADDEAERAISDNRDALDRLEVGAGTKIAKTMFIRRQYEKDIALVRQAYPKKPWLGSSSRGIFDDDSDEPDPNQVGQAIRSVARKYDHPMMWDDFCGLVSARGGGTFYGGGSGSGIFDDDSDNRDEDRELEKKKARAQALAAANALLKVSERLADETEPWNTYGDVPYLIEFELNSDEFWQANPQREHSFPRYAPPPNSLKGLLSDKEYAHLWRNVRAAIEAENKAATAAGK